MDHALTPSFGLRRAVEDEEGLQKNKRPSNTIRTPVDRLTRDKLVYGHSLL